jgi:hypothetical protein
MCSLAEEPFLEEWFSAVHDYRSTLKPHINLLPPGLNRCFDSGLLRGEFVEMEE